MSISKELEDSLQACQEIQNKMANGELITDYDENKTTVSQNPMDEEINRILAQYGASPTTNSSKTTESLPTLESLSTPEETKEQVAETDETDNTSEHHPKLKSMLSFFICLFTALLLALLITQYIAHHTSVEGSSMETTLADGDQLVVENISYYLHEPERFDVIVFPNSQGINYIKRIVGLPGESIQIIDGYIYINGKQLEESFGNEGIEDAGLAAEEIVLGKQEYFVLGDNRNGSIDSRKSEVGTVKRNQIKGKAWLRFYPFSRFGSIK